MSEDDPLSALSAAAKKRTAPSALPRRSGHYPPPSQLPRRPQKSSYFVPLLIGLGILAVGVPAGILITMKLLEPPPPPPKTTVIIQPVPVPHPPGELFKNVPMQETTPSKRTPAVDPDKPPPDPE